MGRLKAGPAVLLKSACTDTRAAQASQVETESETDAEN